jgi:hypothetical protein
MTVPYAHPADWTMNAAAAGVAEALEPHRPAPDRQSTRTSLVSRVGILLDRQRMRV